jgi:hypothetical protein
MERKDIQLGSGVFAGIAGVASLSGCANPQSVEVQELHQEVDQVGEEETSFVIDNNRAPEMAIIQEEESITEDMNREVTLEEAEEILAEKELAHMAYWTTETKDEDKPEISTMDIIAGHTDMNEDGYAILYIMTDKSRTHEELLGDYFDGYSGELTEENIQQIAYEKENTVRNFVNDYKIGQIVVVDEPQAENFEEPMVTHIDYWTKAHEVKPDFSHFDIISCHSDPDENGNAKITFLVRGTEPITEDMLVHTYYNGFEGNFSDEVKNQIKTELEDGIRPHVPGFNLTEVVVIYLP